MISNLNSETITEEPSHRESQPLKKAKCESFKKTIVKKRRKVSFENKREYDPSLY